MNYYEKQKPIKSIRNAREVNHNKKFQNIPWL